MEIIIALLSVFSLVIVISMHEFCHALAADKLGDPTPRAYGRLTLNPIAHVDPIGTILLPLFGALSGFPVIGWAKPTPIDPYNFKNPRRDETIVAFAGPLSNFILAFLLSLFHSSFATYVGNISLFLGIFNLLPIPPLDGSKILLNLLPVDEAAKIEASFEHYGYLLIALLLISGLLGKIIYPIFYFVSNLLY
ncbi:MAG TPA: site-2 protease family protein [Candidatus Woesebacteria bacterium]|nr:site-2 protease family protein [Candidatus Woesebacteria bacterium]HOY61203.1 site-2 protease family protein [Candidatus Woesebacteria bacterium]HPR99448.1 site-2 protease family protein [Candidatus Woesebacteria bacterium]